VVLAGQAIEDDSMYAPAWVRLAWSYGLLRDFVPDSNAAYGDRSMMASERALALDSSNAAAMSLVAAHRVERNDLSTSIEGLARRGVTLEPGVESAMNLAAVLLDRGKVDEAVGVIREAARHDSLSPVIWASAAFRFREARHFGEEARAWERSLALRPSAKDSLEFQRARRWAHLEAGDCAGALRDGQAATDRLLIVESLRCLGRTAEADSIIDSRLALSTISPESRAIYLAWRNQPDSAFAVLDRAFPRWLGETIQHPAFDPYRWHPANLALRRRMGLDR
jgi:tetratricopeptide (TPR) repeat protein